MTLSYRNPVFPHYFADPFVLRVGREYWAYGTAPPDERGRHFPILRSNDLAHWIKMFLVAVSATSEKGKETFQQILRLKTEAESKIMCMGRRANNIIFASASVFRRRIC